MGMLFPIFLFLSSLAQDPSQWQPSTPILLKRPMNLELLFPSAEKLLHFRLEVNATISEGILSRIPTRIEQTMAILSVSI